MSHSRNHWLWITAGAALVVALFGWRQYQRAEWPFRKTEPDTWWSGNWTPLDGSALPLVELYPVNNRMTGQFVVTHAPGYHRSLAVVAGQTDQTGERVLFAVEAALPAGGQGLSWYLLVARGPDRAELFRLRPTLGEIYLQRPGAAGGRTVVYPANTDAHERIAWMARSTNPALAKEASRGP